MKEHIKVLLSVLFCHSMTWVVYLFKTGKKKPKKINECILELIEHYLSDFWKMSNNNKASGLWIALHLQVLSFI